MAQLVFRKGTVTNSEFFVQRRQCRAIVSNWRHCTGFNKQHEVFLCQEQKWDLSVSCINPTIQSKAKSILLFLLLFCFVFFFLLHREIFLKAVYILGNFKLCMRYCYMDNKCDTEFCNLHEWPKVTVPCRGHHNITNKHGSNFFFIFRLLAQPIWDSVLFIQCCLFYQLNFIIKKDTFYVKNNRCFNTDVNISLSYLSVVKKLFFQLQMHCKYIRYWCPLTQLLQVTVTIHLQIKTASVLYRMSNVVYGLPKYKLQTYKKALVWEQPI